MRRPSLMVANTPPGADHVPGGGSLVVRTDMLVREREPEAASGQTGIAVRLLIVVGIVLALVMAGLRHNGLLWALG